MVLEAVMTGRWAPACSITDRSLRYPGLSAGGGVRLPIIATYDSSCHFLLPRKYGMKILSPFAGGLDIVMLESQDERTRT